MNIAGAGYVVSHTIETDINFYSRACKLRTSMSKINKSMTFVDFS